MKSLSHVINLVLYLYDKRIVNESLKEPQRVSAVREQLNLQERFNKKRTQKISLLGKATLKR
jgi:hypothetical protein